MAVENFPGGTVYTGRDIRVFQLCTLRAAVKLEGKGLRVSRINATRAARKQLGLPPRTPREKVLAALDRRIELAIEDANKER
jgi:hypothetical protein